jgi:hypothetical protein
MVKSIFHDIDPTRPLGSDRATRTAHLHIQRIGRVHNHTVRLQISEPFRARVEVRSQADHHSYNILKYCCDVWPTPTKIVAAQMQPVLGGRLEVNHSSTLHRASESLLSWSLMLQT